MLKNFGYKEKYIAETIKEIFKFVPMSIAVKCDKK